MYILCLLHPFTPLLCTHCSHITHQHRETLHIQDYSHKEHHKSDHISIKWSSLTHLTYFFWLFRDLDLKSHSITCQGYASPIYYNLHLLSLMAHPSWPACSAKLNGNSLIKDKYFWKSLSEWLHTEAFLPLSTGEQPQEVELLHKNNWDLQMYCNILLVSS